MPVDAVEDVLKRGLEIKTAATVDMGELKDYLCKVGPRKIIEW